MKKFTKRRKSKLIVIGTSAGGFDACSKIFSLLPHDFKIPIVVVQHILKDSDNLVPKLFNEKFQFYCKEAEEKEYIQEGTIYFAPPNYHLLLETDLSFSLDSDIPVHYARPSIDVFFESAAWSVSKELVGVLLTGANADGAQGLKAILDQGGQTFVQDPQTAESPEMPTAALEQCTDHVVATIEEIVQSLIDLGA